MPVAGVIIHCRGPFVWVIEKASPIGKPPIKTSEENESLISGRSLYLKENISPYKSVLADIGKLNISTYRYKSHAPDSRSFGLIAQNVAEYFPEIVSETQDKDGRKILGVAYGKTGVLAIKAIQEQQVIIEKQQQQINLLLKRVEALEKK